MIFSVILEFGFQVIFEFLAELGWRSLGEGFRSRKRTHPVAAAAALGLTGALLGGITALVLPNRIFGFRGIPGATLVLSPLLTGSVMEAYGRWCDRHGRDRSSFGTFWGGAIFAFGMAAIRFYLVGVNE